MPVLLRQSCAILVLLQAGTHVLSVAAPNGSNATVWNSPWNIFIVPGPAVSTYSACSMSAVSQALGSTATATVVLKDAYNNSVMTPPASSCAVKFYAGVGSRVLVHSRQAAG